MERGSKKPCRGCWASARSAGALPCQSPPALQDFPASVRQEPRTQPHPPGLETPLLAVRAAGGGALGRETLQTFGQASFPWATSSEVLASVCRRLMGSSDSLNFALRSFGPPGGFILAGHRGAAAVEILVEPSLPTQPRRRWHRCLSRAVLPASPILALLPDAISRQEPA